MPDTQIKSQLLSVSYSNPILYADYSDPDAIRVGDDYWLIASSFSHVPGLPILHSKDLVNWELVNHALPRLIPEDHFKVHRAGCGVWAPALRHHAGLFWIFYPDPDFGIYVTTAKDPREAWSPPYLIKAGKGIIDPCPLWDGDKAYFVHGWAKSRAGICNIITLHEMSLDGRTLLDEGTTIIDGERDTQWHTIEGPKLYKHGGWFWVFAPADGVATGCQTVFRSRSIRGPYEGRKVLEQGSTPINGPHQGAWVDTPEGDHWFLHFQEHQPFGRVVHLQPMQWGEDGWPVMGRDSEGTGVGEPVATGAVATSQSEQAYAIPQSDDFSSPQLGLQWQWQGNSNPSWYRLEPSQGTLRLNCVSRLSSDSLWEHPAIILQMVTGPKLSASVELDGAELSEGDTAAFMVFGYDYFWIGLSRKDGNLKLVITRCLQAQKGGVEETVSEVPALSPSLKINWTMDTDGSGQFRVGAVDAEPQAFGPSFSVRESKWVGARFGFFATHSGEQASSGYANFKNLIVS